MVCGIFVMLLMGCCFRDVLCCWCVSELSECANVESTVGCVLCLF